MKKLFIILIIILLSISLISVFVGCDEDKESISKVEVVNNTESAKHYEIDLTMDNQKQFIKYVGVNSSNNKSYVEYNGVLRFAYYEDVEITAKVTYKGYKESSSTEPEYKYDYVTVKTNAAGDIKFQYNLVSDPRTEYNWYYYESSTVEISGISGKVIFTA